MKKIENIYITIVLILIIIVSISIIYSLMNPKYKDIASTTTTVIIENSYGYDEVEKETDYIQYQFNKSDLNELEFKDDNITFEFKENQIIINNKTILKEITMNRQFAKYNNKYIFIYNKDLFSGILIYDTSNNTFKTIEKYGKYYISSKDLSFTNNSIIFTATLVDGKNIYLTKKPQDICKINHSSELSVKESTLYNVSKETYEIIAELNYANYKEEICN